VIKTSKEISLYSYLLVAIDDDPSIKTQLYLVLILYSWLLHNLISFDSMCCRCDFLNLLYLLVSDNILSNNGYVTPCSMNIIEYSIFFLGNVDVDLLVFLKTILGNEGIDMVSPLMVFLCSSHPYHWSCFSRQWHPPSFVLSFNTTYF
jgi:hypothetical protein